MRVLQVYKAALPHSMGGVERVIDGIAGGLVSAGHQATVLAIGPREEVVTQPPGYRVHTVSPDFELASCPVALAALPLLRRLAADAEIVHYHAPWPWADAMHLLGAALDRPTVVSYQSDVVRQRVLGAAYRPLMHAFLRRADRIIASSPDYVASSPVLARYRERTRVVPIGIAEGPAAETLAERAEAWRARVGGPFFLFLGVLRYYKGLPWLLEALAGTGMRLVIAGDGPLRTELEARARALGVLEQVLFAGHIDDADKWALIDACRALVLPSHLRSEAYGVALVEGAARGRPLISCAMGTGTSFINRDGETGHTVPPADARALRRALERLWSNDAEAARMGAAARRRYLDGLRQEDMAHGVMAVYNEVARPGGQPQNH